MVDWSKYDPEARAMVHGRAMLIKRLKEITRLHVSRLTAAKAPPDSTREDGRSMWHISPPDAGPIPFNRHVDNHGNWYAQQNPPGADDGAVVMVLVEPPLVSVEVFALELAKHYFRATGK